MNRKYNTEHFIQNAKSIHGDKYDYSKVEYHNNYTKVRIICPIHGEFKQEPKSHIMHKHGCPICGKLQSTMSQSKSNKQFIEESIKIHGNKYDYSNVEYKNNKTKVCIICPRHGEFHQQPNAHLRGQGCIKCRDEQNGHTKRKSLNSFIKDSIKIHGNRYDYSKVEYKHSHTKICIICPIHGEFWQTPSNHISGRGCPKCNNSKGEQIIEDLLNEMEINYIQQHRFTKCRNKIPLPFDFYLPDHNLCIEYDGEQHFKSVEYWGGNEGLIERKKHDNIKNEFCRTNNIKLVRIKFDDNVKDRLKYEIQ